MACLFAVAITAASAVAEAGPDPDIDGLPYEVSTFSIQWRWDHPDLPEEASMLTTPIALGRTPEGWIRPTAGSDNRMVTLEELNAQGVATYYSSALATISTTLSARLIDDGLMGVFVTFDPEQISDKPQTQGQDLRPDGDRNLTIDIAVGRVQELRTLASGDRIPDEDRVNHPLHRHIIDNAPLKGADERGDGDLLRRQDLEDYFLYLSRHPGRNVEASVGAASQPGGVGLDFMVWESKPLSLFMEFSNTGTQQEGYFRQRYGLFTSQLTGNDDTFSLEYLTSDFSSSNAVFAEYTAKIPGTDRMRWSIGGDWSEFFADEFGVLDDAFTGNSWSINGSVTANIAQNGAFFLDLVGGLRLQHLEVTNNLFLTRGEADFVIPYLMLQADHLGDWSNFSGSLGIEFNLSGHDERTLLELGSRLDTANRWARMNWSAVQYFFLEPLLNPAGFADPNTPETSTLAHEIMLFFSGQYSFGSRLLPQFQQVIGGMYSVRGYPQSVAAGDSSIVAKAEYRYHIPRAFAVNPEPIELFGGQFRAAPQHVYGRTDWDLILCGFLDYGMVMPADPLFFENNETLIGAGVGLEFLFRTNFRFRLDWGFPLRDLPSAGVEAGDERVYASGTVTF
ncbi:MAG TPA: hypothetical protein DEO57_05915 [Phycisphaerales bacterium]|nr:hypothetical protein [Phycisphaerales bacterium]